MAENTGKGDRSFKTNIDTLFDELSLAFQWHRPSLLLTVHKSSIGQDKAREGLAKKLNNAGRLVIDVRVNETDPDVSLNILDFDQPAEKVFFVSGLDYGGGPDGGNAFRALNMARESFVENQLKVVFWLTGNEAASITRLAPDFWAFRHRVIEFASSAPQLGGLKLNSLLRWHGADMPTAPAELKAKIENEERSLKELPNSPDALSARIEACFLIGHACWAAGDYDRALKSLMSGIGLAQDKDFAPLNTWLLNGIAILRHERKKYAEVAEILQDLSAHDSNDVLVQMNLAVNLCSLGRNHDGITTGIQAINRRPEDARGINILGHLYLALGKMDEARSCFGKAIELHPRRAGFHESMAACLFKMGLRDEALGEIKESRQFSFESYKRPAVFEHALLGNSHQAVKLLETALADGKISRATLQHDINLGWLIDQELLPA